MNTPLITFRRGYLLLVCAFLSLPLVVAAQFVAVTAQVESYHWHLQLERELTIRCVVGTNQWQMEGDFCSNCKVSYWFTGHEIIEHSVVDRELPSKLWGHLGIGSPAIGTEATRAYESVDGNPCLPRRVHEPDRLCPAARLGWLAFCSGPCLKRNGRELFPPSDLWKELIPGDHFTDRVTSFQDSLGLPKSVTLYTTNQIVVQYQVTAATNVLGWEFPTEFYLAQYRPAPLPNRPGFTVGTNGWELEFTAKGRVIQIGAGTEPQVPAAVLKGAVR